MPEFFIPAADQDNQEEVLEALAQMCGVAKPAPGDRVYSMTWNHDGTEWIATVGEKFRGVQTIVKGRGRQKRELRVARSTNDTVLAIFPGAPFLIAHTAQDPYWNMPVLAGNPSNVVRFDPG